MTKALVTILGSIALLGLGSACGDDSSGAASSSGASGASAGSHQDGTQNTDETDVDCGGQQADGTGKAARCADGRKCLDASDCTSLSCDGTTKLCAAPAPSDKVKNGDETGVDCGGPEANPRCPTGEGCLAGTDCESKVCDTGSKTCSAPTNGDGQANGDESDVDCGGTTTAAPRCAVGKTCNVHADCGSDGCGYDKKCVENKSCAQHHGGDTCGPLDKPESCCTSIAVTKPDNTKVRVDKFMITAGRFRQFVERTNGDLRGYISKNRPSWWEPAWDDRVPNQLNDGQYISHDGVYQELGPGLFFDPGGGNQGCDSELNGARTYWIPKDVSRALWDDVQSYTQEVLDEKALNCATFFMLSAFCAWDGGRLPTADELDFVWTGGAANPAATHKYPWGQTPEPAGWDTGWKDLADAQANGTKTPAAGDQTFSSYLFNWWSPSTETCIDGRGCDWSVHVAPPGRFPKGNGPFGHSDLAGLLLHITSDIQPGGDLDSRTVAWHRNGSWEGHTIPFYEFGSNPNRFRPTSKYRSSGARCARDN
jgi:hypothetical protein